MGKANKFLSQARRIELYEQTMRELTARTAQHVTEIAALQERVRDLEQRAEAQKQLHEAFSWGQLQVVTALTGSWRERREARRALNG